MAQKISVEKFYHISKDIPIIDVRSPKEFETGHFPGAFNIPIFNNEERAKVGTTYKQVNRNKAIIKGLEIVGPKLAEFVKQAQKIAVDNQLLLYCWRGGMRSASMAWLFETAGLEVKLLTGGYKAFRSYGKSQLAASKKLIVLGGLTGSGKTEILWKIKEQEEQVIDLEGIAHHKGSVFGALGQEKQLINEQFENDLIYEWLSLDLTKPIWLEDESHSIGSNWIPDELFTLMRKSSVLKIEIDKKLRVNRLVKEYAGFDTQHLENCILRIGKKLGGQNVKQAIDSLKNEQLDVVADITLRYYDKSYSFGLEQRKDNTVYPVNLDTDDPIKNAGILIEFAKRKLY